MSDALPDVPSGAYEAIRPHAATLCNECVGRAYARTSMEGNAARGARLRTMLGVPTPEACQLCEDLPRRVPTWVERCLEAARDYEYATFVVGSVLFPQIRRREEKFYEQLRAAAPDFAALAPAKPNSPPWTLGEWLKTAINRDVGNLIEAATGKKAEFARPELTFRLDTRFDHVDLSSADLFARGRYRKLVRDLPQTRWPCRACNGLGCRQCGGKGKTYETSVEELIAEPVVRAAGAAQEAFHGMGREDIDARALGSGRPFILELKRPRRRTLDWSQLEKEINETTGGRVEVERLAGAGPDDAARYKAADPDKTYRARCHAGTSITREQLEGAVQGLSGVELEQRTPQRVSHRRGDLVRRRQIQSLRLLSHEGELFEIEIRADSGTYIKEFVSGDEGRTRPSLSQTLGVEARVVELDVMDVDWNE